MKNSKIRWITRTAVLLAMLIALQWATKPLGQLVTGSCVNAILSLSALLGGCWSGITIALLSPVFAYLLGIAPQLVTVPAIMVGNTVFVVFIWLLAGKDNTPIWRQIAAWVLAATAKFCVLYLMVNTIICGLASDALLEHGLLKEPMLAKLPGMFSWPQLVTALIGGGVALLVAPLIRRALRKSSQ